MVSPRSVERNYHAENTRSETVAQQQIMENQDHLIRPKKPSNPVLESPNHRVLHRELRVSHRWGLLPAEKCELQRVMEQRRLEQQREREQALRPLTDLEQELCKRRQRLLTYELEEQKRQEDLQNVPEFVRVKDNLRHVRVS
ncbi:protein FAM107B isoform X2 [Pangasianodon hypophthalmus]|nr:protein FAM107B isoform X2 [Pangasianodon hypophthalmus]XP_053082962.1 protein FAM107B isoform X2 [Pangasianodon hypophthalmus]XP_053082963.1 protein FAM107B isoform X2 [Pangasianodon hypophthalmus]